VWEEDERRRRESEEDGERRLRELIDKTLGFSERYMTPRSTVGCGGGGREET